MTLRTEACNPTALSAVASKTGRINAFCRTALCTEINKQNVYTRLLRCVAWLPVLCVVARTDSYCCSQRITTVSTGTCTRRTSRCMLFFVEILNSLHTGDACAVHVCRCNHPVELCTIFGCDGFFRDERLCVHHSFVSTFN